MLLGSDRASGAWVSKVFTPHPKAHRMFKASAHWEQAVKMLMAFHAASIRIYSFHIMCFYDSTLETTASENIYCERLETGARGSYEKTMEPGCVHATPSSELPLRLQYPELHTAVLSRLQIRLGRFTK